VAIKEIYTMLFPHPVAKNNDVASLVQTNSRMSLRSRRRHKKMCRLSEATPSLAILVRPDAAWIPRHVAAI
jgi:hypothetical protein